MKNVWAEKLKRLVKNVWAEKNVFGLKRELFWAEKNVFGLKKKGTRELKRKERQEEKETKGQH